MILAADRIPRRSGCGRLRDCTRETETRKSEGIRLTWSHIDFHQSLLTVERSKNRKPRYVPLSSLPGKPVSDASVDIRTVQELPGHQSITTAMPYAHYAPQHATQSIREVQRREAESFVSAQKKNRR